jgi:pyruvate dehydrogenase E2 component (dihydrolipoamide acetyltransferase)
MSIIFRMPALSPTMVTGTIVSWHKREGEEIEVGDVLVEIDTDKATMEVESVHRGVLEKILVEDGTRDVNVGIPIGFIREKGDTDESLQNALASLGGEPIAPQQEDHVYHDSKNEARTISPLARRISGMYGIDVAKIQHGSGPGGRIVKDDVLKVIASDSLKDYLVEKEEPLAESDTPVIPAIKANNDAEDYVDEPLPPIQRRIAERVVQSWHDAPHFYVTSSINVTELLRVKAQINDSGVLEVKLTVTDFIIKAAALAMVCCPHVNVNWYNGMVRRYKKSNVAVVISTAEGIFSPTIYGACSKNICEISKELKELARLAKSKRIPPEMFEGGALTISNLGMFGIDGFFAIVNPPQGTTLSIGPARRMPVYDESGNLSPADIIQFGYSIDHRLINGVDAAQFLEKLAKYIENPLSLIVGI